MDKKMVMSSDDILKWARIMAALILFPELTEDW